MASTIRKRYIYGIAFQWVQNEFFYHQKLCVQIVQDSTKINQVLIDIILINWENTYQSAKGMWDLEKVSLRSLIYLIYPWFIPMRPVICKPPTQPFPEVHEKISGQYNNNPHPRYQHALKRYLNFQLKFEVSCFRNYICTSVYMYRVTRHSTHHLCAIPSRCCQSPEHCQPLSLCIWNLFLICILLAFFT